MRNYLILFTFLISLTLEATETRFYRTLVSSASETTSFTPSNGQRVYLKEMGGNAGNDGASYIEIRFGSTTLLATYGDAAQSSTSFIDGDGVKQIQIVLENASGSTKTIGGYYRTR